MIEIRQLVDDSKLQTRDESVSYNVTASRNVLDGRIMTDELFARFTVRE